MGKRSLLRIGAVDNFWNTEVRGKFALTFPNGDFIDAEKITIQISQCIFQLIRIRGDPAVRDILLLHYQDIPGICFSAGSDSIAYRAILRAFF